MRAVFRDFALIILGALPNTGYSDSLRFNDASLFSRETYELGGREHASEYLPLAPFDQLTLTHRNTRCTLNGSFASGSPAAGCNFWFDADINGTILANQNGQCSSSCETFASHHWQVVPLTTVFDPTQRYVITADVLLEGAWDRTPLLVDTGSSEMAICPDADLGSAPQKTPVEYGCAAYGDDQNQSGWVGTWFQADMVFGNGSEVTRGDKTIDFAWIAHSDDENTAICRTGVQGILGMARDGNEIFNSARQVPKDERGCGEAHDWNYQTTFNSVITQGVGASTMAFVGLNRDDDGYPLMAFGTAAQALLNTKTYVGTAPLIRNVTEWFALQTPIKIYLQNVPHHTNKVTFDGSDGSHVIVDTGTQQLIVPTAFQDMLTSSDLPHNAELVVELPWDVFLKFPVKDLGLDNIGFADTPTLGLPVFWYYDVHINTDHGQVSFFDP
ncbi:hypothetical protein ACOTTU_01100 [Roseobacter sp. EG26]|uniref:hypothetical protein n=1 Tax=Roseobacter sp. EG26 TaxID=3412477 RepID=UPI003CE58638